MYVCMCVCVYVCTCICACGWVRSLFLLNASVCVNVHVCEVDFPSLSLSLHMNPNSVLRVLSCTGRLVSSSQSIMTYRPNESFETFSLSVLVPSFTTPSFPSVWWFLLHLFLLFSSSLNSRSAILSPSPPSPSLLCKRRPKCCVLLLWIPTSACLMLLCQARCPLPGHLLLFRTSCSSVVERVCLCVVCLEILQCDFIGSVRTSSDPFSTHSFATANLPPVLQYNVTLSRSLTTLSNQSVVIPLRIFDVEEDKITLRFNVTVCAVHPSLDL